MGIPMAGDYKGRIRGKKEKMKGGYIMKLKKITEKLWQCQIKKCGAIVPEKELERDEKGFFHLINRMGYKHYVKPTEKIRTSFVLIDTKGETTEPLLTNHHEDWDEQTIINRARKIQNKIFKKKLDWYDFDDLAWVLGFESFEDYYLIREGNINYHLDDETISEEEIAKWLKEELKEILLGEEKRGKE
jgi:hypothetical protein